MQEQSLPKQLFPSHTFSYNVQREKCTFLVYNILLYNITILDGILQPE